MPRDSNGNYTSPSANFVPGTTILAGVMNGKFNDVEGEITNSLDRNGKGAMLAPMRVPDGTINLPGYAFSTETTLGIRRAGTADMRVCKDGTDLFRFNTSEIRAYVATKISTGGLTVDAGGLTVTSGNLLIDSGTTQLDGALTVTAGGSSLTGTLPASGTVAGPHLAIASGTMASTSGNTYPLHTARGTGFGGNALNLTARALNTTTVTDWNQIDLGLSYDVDASVASGGSFYLGKNGATITSGTAATGATPANALTLANGNLKLSGTAPNSDAAGANTLTPMLTPKAVARITTDGAGGATLTGRAANIASVAINGTNLRITFVDDFTDANFIVVANSTLSAVTPTNYDTTAGTSRVDISRIGGGSMDNAGETTIIAFGLQA